MLSVYAFVGFLDENFLVFKYLVLSEAFCAVLLVRIKISIYESLVWLHQTRIGLSLYDVTGQGYLRECVSIAFYQLYGSNVSRLLFYYKGSS